MSTIAVEALTKRYGTVTAVSDLSFELAPGRITGFLGPNGAGKSTTIRLLLGLAEPTSGRATINGHPYAELRDPLRRIGALTAPDVFHPGRSGRTALRIAARPARIGGQRVEEVLQLVGLGGPPRAGAFPPRRTPPAPPPGRPRLYPGKEPVMRSLVSAELLKLRATRSAWIPLAAALALAVVAVLASTTAAGPDASPHLSPAALPALLRGSGGQLLDGAVLLCWIGLSAGDFRHRTAVTTFLAEPNRLRIVAAH